ncbi:MAG: hypothetical protein AAF234_08705 [Pseudomonadota bacterium]
MSENNSISASGIKTVAEIIEKYVDKLIAIKDSQRKKEELARIHSLLDRVRQVRTANVELPMIAEHFWDDQSNFAGEEFDIFFDKIESGITNIEMLVDRIATSHDQIVLEDNEAFQELANAARGRIRLSQGLRAAIADRDRQKYDRLFENYIFLSNRLGEMSFRVAEAAKKI